MLPRSISFRALCAFGLVLALALGLLFSGGVIARDVSLENVRVGRLSQILRDENTGDEAQQHLRLALGDLTRVAERGEPVEPSQATRVRRELRAFAAGAATRKDEDVPADIAPLLAERGAAAREFAVEGAAMLAAAQQDPAAIKRRMPQFLGTLNRLEQVRADLRRALTHGIDDAVARGAFKVRRNRLHVLIGGTAMLAVLLLLVIWMRQTVIRPILAIAERLRQFNAGQDERADVPGADRPDELGELARGLAEYRRAMQERRRAERRVAFLAHHDVMTGLPNRLLFEERLAHELARSARTGDTVAVFAIDLDDFKAINDRFGHAGGDRALKRAAQLLRDAARGDDLVARLGGDEFAIIQAAAQQPRAAEALLQRIFAALAETAKEEITLRMSVGIAVSGPDQDFEELYNLADMAMYRAKSEGRNTARFFDDRLKEEVRLRWRLGRDLDGAIDRGEMRLLFQPIADAHTLATTGYEALLRWSHPELGEIAPDVFVPLAEASGDIAAIGRWVADSAMAHIARVDPSLSIALNLSPIQFREPALAGYLLATARRHGIAPERLEFEVTESATLLGHNSEAVLATLRELQARGARVVMDDFGTGYSSLGNLREFRFDKLKVDRSFVMSMADHAPSASIVRSVIALGRSLGIPVVAEGVETEAQLAMLRQWACDEVQGYLIGRPAPLPLAHVVAA